MRILFLTAGSRGDVEPFVALGRRAAREGHVVRIGVTREFVEAVTEAGLDCAPLDGDFQAIVEAQGVSALAAMRAYRSTIGPMMNAILRSAAQAAVSFRPDVIVHHPKILSADVAAAHLGIPTVLVEMVPVSTPTRLFPAPGVGSRDLGPLNPLTYKAAASAAGMFRGVIGDLRSELGVRNGPLQTRKRILVTVSPALLPRPDDWPSTTVMTGQLHEADAAPEPLDGELDAFLGRGDDVLYAGFGSMSSGDAAGRGRAIVGAARAAGLRALVATGWGGIEVPADVAGADVLVRKAVPHAEVLGRCAVAVHHGGAGTVHAVVRAGLPSIVVPFLADQPFWGRLLARRGLGAAPVPPRRVTASSMEQAIRAAPSRAAVLPVAEQLRGEDGCGTALAEIVAVG